MKSHLIPLALSGASAVAVGFARFGYALILPAMKTDLALNYAQAGWLNTANSLGYLVGSLLTIWFVARLGNQVLFTAGILLTTLSLLASGLTHDFLWLSLLRFLAGFGGAGAFICGGVLASVLGIRAIAVYFSGGGVGMLLTGATLPWLFSYAGHEAWPLAWLAVGAVCIPISVAAIFAIQGIPEPYTRGASTRWRWRHCMAEFTAYFLFGLGYIAYMTFIIAWVKRHSEESAQLAVSTSVMWMILGIMTLFAPTLWKRLFDARADGKPMASCLLVLALGAALPLLTPGLAGIWLSAALVGGSVFMVPSAITGFVKSNLPMPSWGNALAMATSLFAIGQTIGPVASGWISDMSGTLSTGLGFSAGILVLAAIFALVQKPLPPAHATL